MLSFFLNDLLLLTAFAAWTFHTKKVEPVQQFASAPPPLVPTPFGALNDTTTLHLKAHAGHVRHEIAIHAKTPPDTYVYGGHTYHYVTTHPDGVREYRETHV